MKLLKLIGSAAAALGSGVAQPAPASRMGAEVFFKAAQDAGLPTDYATLNQIVDLVNQGLSPEIAATRIKGKKSGPLGGLLAQNESRGLLDGFPIGTNTKQP